MALNSRDRMMLVHETSNFPPERTLAPGHPEAWPPEAVTRCWPVRPRSNLVGIAQRIKDHLENAAAITAAAQALTQFAQGLKLPRW